MKALLRRILFQVDAHGNTNQPQTGRLLFIANHEWFFDGLLNACFSPSGQPLPCQATVLDKPILLLMPTRVSHLSVDPTNQSAMKGVIGLPETGKPLMHDLQLPGYPGAFLLAVGTGGLARKQQLASPPHPFPPGVFETRRFFERKSA